MYEEQNYGQHCLNEKIGDPVERIKNPVQNCERESHIRIHGLKNGLAASMLGVVGQSTESWYLVKI